MIIDLKAADRWQAIDELIDNLVATSKIKPEFRDLITNAVKKRESAMSTGIGFGIGMPHASTDLIQDAVSVFGRSKKGIDFNALDGLPVHRVVLFLVPKGQFQKHVNTLANLAKLLHRAEFRDAMFKVSDDASLNRLIGFNPTGNSLLSSAMLPHKKIEQLLQQAAHEVLPDADVSSILVRPCDPKHGDYQSNALMSLAKARKMNPRQLATNVLGLLDVSDFCEKVEVAGAGFLNFRLLPATVAQTLEAAARGEHLFFDRTDKPRTIVVDFSSPNVAKPMHVGHIRSTGIGDAFQRTLRLLGHHVISDNHIGDWGTQFGMLIFGWKREMFSKGYANAMAFRSALNADPLGEMERLEWRYKSIAAESQSNPEILDNCREELVKLQQGDAANEEIWEIMVEWSKNLFEKIYSRLGVKFDVTLGESFYNPELGVIVNDLLKRGIARESEGAVAVFSDGSLPPKEDPFLVNRDGEWVADPALVRKSDGGFNYMTTDLATIDYRLKTWSPDEIVYVVDDRQGQHFKKLFLTFARWQPEASKKVKLVHVGFGKILGDDGKPFKTRSGDTVKLGDLLDESQQRAFDLVKSKQLERPEAERVPEKLWPEIARVVGIGSVKYADLLPNRQSDYIFSWDKMLAFNGNTAPYLQYAYARIQSIFRKAEATSNLQPPTSNLQLAAPEEIALARHLLNFGLTLEAVTEELRPNFLCNYLFELAGKFTSFYENCPVLKADNEATRASRLVLCDLTVRVLKQGLATLGIETVEQM